MKDWKIFKKFGSHQSRTSYIWFLRMILVSCVTYCHIVINCCWSIYIYIYIYIYLWSSRWSCFFLQCIGLFCECCVNMYWYGLSGPWCMVQLQRLPWTCATGEVARLPLAQASECETQFSQHENASASLHHMSTPVRLRYVIRRSSKEAFVEFSFLSQTGKRWKNLEIFHVTVSMVWRKNYFIGCFGKNCHHAWRHHEIHKLGVASDCLKQPRHQRIFFGVLVGALLVRSWIPHACWDWKHSSRERPSRRDCWSRDWRCPSLTPLNSSSLREGKLDAGSPMGWNKEDIERGLAHATPLVLGLARAAPVLKAAHALSHYNPGQQRHEVKDAPGPDIRLDFLRPQRLRGSGGGRGVGVITSKTPQPEWKDSRRCQQTLYHGPNGRFSRVVRCQGQKVQIEDTVESAQKWFYLTSLDSRFLRRDGHCRPHAKILHEEQKNHKQRYTQLHGRARARVLRCVVGSSVALGDRTSFAERWWLWRFSTLSLVVGVAWTLQTLVISDRLFCGVSHWKVLLRSVSCGHIVQFALAFRPLSKTAREENYILISESISSEPVEMARPSSHRWLLVRPWALEDQVGTSKLSASHRIGEALNTNPLQL